MKTYYDGGSKCWGHMIGRCEECGELIYEATTNEDGTVKEVLTDLVKEHVCEEKGVEDAEKYYNEEGLV